MKLLIWLSIIAIVNAADTVVSSNCDLNGALSIVQHNKDSSNQEVARLVYNHLTSTYPRRNWFVVVYDDVSGHEDHQIRKCEGGHAFRFNGFNIMVASSSSDAPSMSFSNARSILNSPRLISHTGFWGETHYRRARDILRTISHYVDCRNYSGLAVIKQGADIAVEASWDRFLLVNRDPFSMVIFS